MSFNADSLGLAPAAAALLRDLIHDRTGLYYAESRFDMLADRLAPLVADRGFASFLDYYYFLKYDSAASSDWNRVIDALSVPETYFWREVDQIQAIVTHAIPRLAARRTGTPIRIWSVPCASGEEPLTIAMALEEERWFNRATIDLCAGDASLAALARARAGSYRERAFRALPLALRDRYFRPCRDSWTIDPAIYARVRSWQQLNLAAPDDLEVIARSDIVFCRNVFIYFSDDAVRRVVNALADGMPAGGLLCVGASESLLRITDRFELEQIGSAFVYVKNQ
jgi:chemotaxis protein methyltransferase CheR